MITANQFCHVANLVNTGLQMYLSWILSDYKGVSVGIVAIYNPNLTK